MDKLSVFEEGSEVVTKCNQLKLAAEEVSSILEHTWK